MKTFDLQSRAKHVLMALLLAVPSLAFGAGVELKTEAFHEVETTRQDGSKAKELQPLVRAVPGQEVVYITTYRNTGNEPAAKVVLKNPVPQGLAYKAGSAQGAGARAEVSVDGGKQFGVLPMLSVRGPDGKTRPATADDVTDVRWTLTAPVQPGAEGKVTYRARLR